MRGVAVNSRLEHAGSTPSGPVSARERAAEALREVAELFMSRRFDDRMYYDLRAVAEYWARILRTATGHQLEGQHLRSAFFPQDCADGDSVNHFKHCFVSGSSSPIGMGLRAHRRGDEVHAVVQFGRLYEGAPGRVHGGALAAAFDDVTSLVLNVHRLPAFTAALTVSYRRPVAIDVPVVLRALLVDRSSRRLTISATATVDDEVVAEAEAVFVVVTKERWITGREEGSKP